MTTTRSLLGRTGMFQVALLLAFVAIAAAVVAVIAPLYRLAQSGGYVEVLRGEPRVGVDEHLPEGVRLISTNEMVTLAVDEMPTGLRLLTEASTAVTALAVAAGAWWLGRLIGSIQAGRPFDRRNPARLAGVAAAVVLGGTVGPVLGGVLNDVVLEALDLFPPRSPLGVVVFELNLAPLFIAVLVLAVAEAFRRGGTLAEDVDGLV